MDQRAHLNRTLWFRLKGFFCKAFTNLGRILKTLYILCYLTDPILRQTVQLQLNKSNMGLMRVRWWAYCWVRWLLSSLLNLTRWQTWNC
ncbi:Tn3 family transposase (plasmid) [Phormidium sp. CLA17]|uniref:Tn3 family transposase n=1 Tax=Leptolyngbya sp. Cla-17 TaxID=2803751 RepID=UPI0017A48704|nr:Tn3 family transposase [Leptolyngbya sp. Cla-17]